MQAFLGSCVGITLCDRKAGIGGLIHLLLPEPPSMDKEWNREVNAVTGMPIFIGELCARGAKKERLEACVAGGALIDPLSERDIINDFGGQTAEIAMGILRSEDIPIRQSEVGGYFSCRMSLHLSTWETTIDPIVIPAPPETEDRFRPPSLQQLDYTIENLLPVPQIALKITRMANDDKFTFRDIVDEVIKDQVLCARIIRLCNSVCLNASMRVDSVEKALLRIGQKSLLLLALSISMENFISYANQGYSLCKGGLLNHSIWTAQIGRRLAELCGKVPVDLAFTAGLLHDIGKVVLDQHMHGAYPLFYREIHENGSYLVAAEKEFFGMAHPEAGSRLALRWAMPQSILDAIEHHHEPDKATANCDLVYLTYLADLISSRFMPGNDLECMATSYMRASLEAIELGPKQLCSVLANTHPDPLKANLRN